MGCEAKHLPQTGKTPRLAVAMFSAGDESHIRYDGTSPAFCTLPIKDNLSVTDSWPAALSPLDPVQPNKNRCRQIDAIPSDITALRSSSNDPCPHRTIALTHNGNNQMTVELDQDPDLSCPGNVTMVDGRLGKCVICLSGSIVLVLAYFDG